MTEKRICIFIGPPGAGKGSLSSRCVKELGCKQLSTGNLCREHIARGTEIGQKIDFAIKSGKLISDDLIIEMVNLWMVENEQQAQTIILDGFPRTTAQAQALHAYISNKYKVNSQLHVVHLKVSERELIRRVLERTICSNKKCQAVYSCSSNVETAAKRAMVCDDCEEPLTKRSDDNEQAVRQRLKSYYEHEHELLDYYNAVGIKPYTLQGERSLCDVFAELKNVLT